MWMMNVITIFTAINVLLVAGLLYVYAATFRRTRSLFTVGLLLFAFLFLIQDVVALYFAATMMPLYEPDVASFVLVFTLLQTAAFAILNWITWK
jgi:hypothetical protein